MKTSYMIVGHNAEILTNWVVASNFETLEEAIDHVVFLRNLGASGITYTIHAKLNV